MKTSTLPPPAPAWVLIDADGQTIGQVATAAATVLRGKHKPSFSPHQLCGDQVVIINAAKLKIDPRKLDQKLYQRHSGYLGHLKSTPLKTMMEKDPTEVLRIAIKGMLPSNRLEPLQLKMLHIFADSEHPHTAQKPQPLSV
jgi:large subunit ribosomal protein L13